MTITLDEMRKGLPEPPLRIKPLGTGISRSAEGALREAVEHQDLASIQAIAMREGHEGVIAYFVNQINRANELPDSGSFEWELEQIESCVDNIRRRFA